MNGISIGMVGLTLALAGCAEPRSLPPRVGESTAPPAPSPTASAAGRPDDGDGAPEAASAAEPKPGQPEPDGEPAPTPPPEPGPPPRVEFGEPQFTSGEIPDVLDHLGRMKKGIATCVAEHGGLSGPRGTVEIQFLVRARGRAEGVEAVEFDHVEASAAECIRAFIKNRKAGIPSEDPIGVVVSIELHR